jgi:hypothetical protein
MNKPLGRSLVYSLVRICNGCFINGWGMAIINLFKNKIDDLILLWVVELVHPVVFIHAHGNIKLCHLCKWRGHKVMAVSCKWLKSMMKVNKATTSGNRGVFGHWTYCKTFFTIVFWREIAKKKSFLTTWYYNNH